MKRFLTLPCKHGDLLNNFDEVLINLRYLRREIDDDFYFTVRQAYLLKLNHEYGFRFVPPKGWTHDYLFEYDRFDNFLYYYPGDNKYIRINDHWIIVI